MALRALPISDSFAIAWEHDPALDRTRENFDHEYQVCLETLNFEPLCIPGQKPTFFHFRPMRGVTQRRLLDMGVGNLVGISLVFRSTLARIENFEGAPALKRARDKDHPELGEMVTEEVIDFLDALPLQLGQPAGSLVSSLGGHVFQRCLGVLPK